MTAVTIDGSAARGDRVERISAKAREFHPVRALLSLIGALLFGLGWVAYRLVAVAWMAGAWCAAAVAVGWADARDAAAARRAPAVDEGDV